MSGQGNFMINLSILYRNTQKFYDHTLSQFDIGSGQLMFLVFINENEGPTMQDVTRLGQVDKGTTTKAINKLIEQGYVRSVMDEKDHRIKRLYITAEGSQIMNEVYTFRNECRRHLAEGIDFDLFEEMLSKAAENSGAILNEAEEDYSSVRIGGLQKMTLLDYPGEAACTIFMAGCRMKCPFCHNRDLVFLPENYEYYDPDEVLVYLKKRKGLLDAVCISGGEPLIQKDLIPFIEQIRSLGYKVKLDTNGQYPAKLKEVVEAGLIDYVAMDIKNSQEKYASTCGRSDESFDISKIKESVEYLMSGAADYEFRTTVVRQLHTAEDMHRIGEWIRGAKRYYLQQFVDSGNIIQNGLSAYGADEMEELRKIAEEYVPSVQLRGVKEN